MLMLRLLVWIKITIINLINTLKNSSQIFPVKNRKPFWSMINLFVLEYVSKSNQFITLCTVPALTEKGYWDDIWCRSEGGIFNPVSWHQCFSDLRWTLASFTALMLNHQNNWGIKNVFTRFFFGVSKSNQCRENTSFLGSLKWTLTAKTFLLQQIFLIFCGQYVRWRTYKRALALH